MDTVKTIYWHRELPPATGQPLGEHTIEANSRRVAGALGHDRELWGRCHAELMTELQLRVSQEIRRLGGDYVHVMSEAIEGKHDSRTDEAWLHGRFTYVLYRMPQP